MADVIYAGDAGLFKVCAKCGEVKNHSSFYRHNKGGAGLTGSCMECVRDHVSAYNAANREVQRVKAAMRRENNPGYYSQHKDEFRARSYKWKLENPERSREIGRDASRRKLATPRGRLDNSISSGVYASLRGLKSGRSTYELLGYTLDQLIAHIGAMLSDGMTWENYGLWHIDHIIPKSAFKYESADAPAFKAAWALNNLQPLWATENQKKHARLDHPSQALGLELMATTAAA